MRRQEAIAVQALGWLMRCGGPDWSEDEQAEFDAWLEESMAHKAAFWRADHGWRQADRIRSLGFDNDELVDEPAARPKWLPAAIAASLIAAVTIGGFSLAPQFADQPAPAAQPARFDPPVRGRQVVPLHAGNKTEPKTQTGRPPPGRAGQSDNRP